MSHFSNNRYSNNSAASVGVSQPPRCSHLEKQAGVTRSVQHSAEGLIPHAVSTGSVCAHPLQGASVTLIK